MLEAGAGAEQGVRIPPTEKDKKYSTQIMICCTQKRIPYIATLIIVGVQWTCHNEEQTNR